MSDSHEYIVRTQQDEMKGILTMLLASFFFSSMGFFVKKLSPHHTPMEIIFFRNIVSLAFIAVSVIISRPVQNGGRPFLLAMRGVYGFLGMFFYFSSIGMLPLASASTFGKTSPLFTAIIAMILIKEKAGIRVWLSILIGFAGVLLILKPTGNTSLSGSLYGVASGFFGALAYTTVRSLAPYYNARTMVLAFSLAGLSGSSIYITTMYLAGAERYVSFAFVPHGIDIFYMFMVGLIAVVAQYFMSRAYYFGRASIVSTMSYSELIFSTIAGYIAGDALPDFLSFCGIFLVGLSGILIVRARIK